MSKQAVRQLIEAARSDEALWRSIEAADQPEAVVRLGAARGFVFTGDELREAIEEMGRAATEELDEGALEKVAGGIGDIKGEIKLQPVARAFQQGPGMVKNTGQLLSAMIGDFNKLI